jgi:hypothetical protein
MQALVRLLHHPRAILSTANAASLRFRFEFLASVQVECVASTTHSVQVRC